VCSWSLGADSPAALVEGVRAVGLDCVQLALDPIRRGEWDEQETVDRLGEAGIAVVSGMMAMAGEDYSSLERIALTGGVRPDATWEENLAATEANAAIASRMGLDLVTYHAGFLAEDVRDPERVRTIERMQRIADIYADVGIPLALETGQEAAVTLVGVLDQLARPNVGVNFDPANMILYGIGDPIEAIEVLSGWVKQVHIKDAKHTATPGTWGTEVRAGDGDVKWELFAGVLRVRELDVDVVIEREAGGDRVGDIRQGVELVRRLGLVG
jgi:sugar phosphate isomerase/epimerase